MSLDRERAGRCLKTFDFEELFIELMGWDHPNLKVTAPAVNDREFEFQAIARKRGMLALRCAPADGGDMPDHATRRKVEKHVAKVVHEHLIIFTDGARKVQIWQWVKREPGKPIRCREHRFNIHQSGESLIQKLDGIAYTLEDEETLTHTGVTGGVRAAFDVERRITKRFYDRFKKQHEAFRAFLKGIPDEALQRWYVSVMLNRLMFIYFIQKKGFLDDDPAYLTSKLQESKHRGKDRFYNDFLCPLFFEGFAKVESERRPEFKKLLGSVPYLNGGIFQRHEIERLHGETIHIADAAFEKIFAFFEEYQWHLDDRPLRNDNEINPDVLGHIFEKYINQKQMGAYYTKEDITGYIAQNTVLPRLFDMVKKLCKVAFVGERSVWSLLSEEPDRYIYPAVKHGCDVPLPKSIAAGIDDVAKRTEWNMAAPEKWALPTEIWREVVARRQRCEEVKAKLANGEITDINDLITYNLDIRQFAQDVVETCEGPDLLRAFWRSINGRIPEKSNENFHHGITILDPTCGSGAFLFAALNILEPLYEACLDRMQAFLDDLDASGAKHSPGKMSDFRKTLEEVAGHPNRAYFVYKSIIINNLFGVDIMEEAVEICKLRLFLKLVAQVDDVSKIEPLPDIDFNIRAGNTLVGYATRDDVKRAFQSGKFDFGDALKKIEGKAQAVDDLFKLFRQEQTKLGAAIEPRNKETLKAHLKELNEELNRYLADEYRIDPDDETAYAKWLKSHKPFHWFIEFYGIMHAGGFDVIIGNPPYVEYSKVKRTYRIKYYKTENCGNLYAFVLERNASLVRNRGRTGMIVPHSAVCTDRMAEVQHLLTGLSATTWISTYGIRPAKLFVGVDQRLAIYVSLHAGVSARTLASRYHHWHSKFRPYLFSLVEYANISAIRFQNSLPKIHCERELTLWAKLSDEMPLSEDIVVRPTNTAYYHNAPRYWIRAMDFPPYFWNEREGEKVSSQVKSLGLASQSNVSLVVAILNSTVFYWWFIILSDCRHLNVRELYAFPVGIDSMNADIRNTLPQLAAGLMDDYTKHAQRKECFYKTTGQVVYDEFYPKYSKRIIDEIDRVLAKHYGFTDEELDFIINYDIKYRMGRDWIEEWKGAEE
ncbi:MAG: Eco57I restriction-modification methylase domain-containing protein [Planctomycetes bacterium]|nr:Eco57I restriction-modification methylase domain-containing protein [Planctomycetota bacterium]